MSRNWSIVVNWDKSNTKFVRLVLRDPAEWYRYAYNLTWIAAEKRLMRSRDLAVIGTRLPQIEDLITSVAKEIVLAKQLLINQNDKTNIQPKNL